ncbi:hypothetical protein FRC02_008195 [Tulasnella sp. 418]|nr:hypothetical protein FRC02_008195 [Tulasnella sp. 418]
MHHKYHVRQPNNIHRRQSGVTPFTGDDDQSDVEDFLDQILSSQASEFLKSRTAAQATSTPVPATKPALTTSPVASTTSVVARPTTTQVQSTIAVASKPATTSTPAQVKTSQAPSTTKQAASTVSRASTSAQNSATAAASNGESKSSGPSPVAIGVTVTLVLLMVGAAGVYFLRRYFIAKRQKKRNTWNPPAGGDFSEKTQEPRQEATLEDNYETIDINEKHGPTPVPYPFTIDNVNNQFPPPTPPKHQEQFYNAAPSAPVVALPAPPPPLHPTGLAPLRSPSPPPVAGTPYNPSPAPVGFDGPSPLATASPAVIPFTPFSSVAPPTAQVMMPAMTQANGATSSAPKSVNGGLFTVIRTFVPSLPDELSLQPGEQVRVVEKYDDGWALCERMSRGAGVESGVAPVECLDLTVGDFGSAQKFPESPAMSSTNSFTGIPGFVPGAGMMQEHMESWRLSKRASSLHQVGPGKY